MHGLYDTKIYQYTAHNFQGQGSVRNDSRRTSDFMAIQNIQTQITLLGSTTSILHSKLFQKP
jgi:hypothetical protein